MTTNLQIVTKDQKTISVSWSDTENLKKWIAHQRTRSHRLFTYSNDIFFLEYQTWIKWYYEQIEKVSKLDLPLTPRILDIGSGIGIIDLLLYQQFPRAQIFLVDAEECAPVNGNLFGSGHPFYNSWDPTRDAITTSQMNQKDFHFLSPTTDWPQNMDLVASHFSWCWHYDVYTYLEKAYNSLKDGGILLLTVRFVNDYDILQIITDKFGCQMNIVYFGKDNQISSEKHLFDVNGSYYGALVAWKKMSDR